MIDADLLKPFLQNTLDATDFTNLGEKYAGKVRDVYRQAEQKLRLLIATDRQSAFDINWTTIPLKGQCLTQISAWWFEQVADIMATQVIATPDPNVVVVKDLEMIPVEIVIRSYLTGSSSTSIWMNYKEGSRLYCGHELPDGMVKNQPLEKTIITPTTKAEEDELIDRDEIIKQGLCDADRWEEIEDKALKIFARGQQLAAERGLILVDTKYEMGLDEDGVLTIADEVHTPDSSRYWIKDTYDELHAAGKEPDSLDKEFFRLWLRSQGFEYEDKATWPEVTDQARLDLAQRYIDLYERMTSETFVLPEATEITERISENLKDYQV